MAIDTTATPAQTQTNSFDEARSSIGKSAKPILDTVRQTARDKPIATYAAAGIFGMAILGSLFGRKR